MMIHRWGKEQFDTSFASKCIRKNYKQWGIFVDWLCEKRPNHHRQRHHKDTHRKFLSGVFCYLFWEAWKIHDSAEWASTYHHEKYMLRSKSMFSTS
jgi:hypothetical protein